MRAITTGIWVILTTVCITSSARAAKWPDAKSAHEAGRAAYEAKRYEDAAEAFKATYSHDPNPVLLVNVAESYKRAGDCVQALAYYERFLKAVPKGDLHITMTGRAAALRPKCPAAAIPPAPAPPPKRSLAARRDW